MKSFSIRNLEHLSGIKTHTIRMWEKRYHLLLPQRNTGNFRYYSFDQLKHLLDIVLLVKAGFKISRVAQLDGPGIKQALDSLVQYEQRQCKAVNMLISSMFCCDIEEFEAILDNCMLSWGTDKTIMQVIIPFLEKTELYSYSNSSSEVHFVVAAIRKKIILGIEKLNAHQNTAKTALLFLPQNEHYDLLLLYMAYLLISGGLKILYLGTDNSIENLKMVMQSKKPDYLYTYIPQKAKFKIINLLSCLEEYLPTTKLFIAGSNNSGKAMSFHNVKFIDYKDAAVSLKECLC